jgi:hypothetical protein
MDNRRMTLVALLGALLVVVGCGSSARPAGAAAACAPLKVNLVGELDGQAVNAQLDVLSGSFQLVAPPYALDVGFFGGGTLEVAWTTAISYRQMTPATGNIVMPPGTPHAGETICAGSGATRYVDSSGGNGGTGAPNNNFFTFDTLTVGPTCPGTAALTGSIDGCAQDSQ